MIPGPSLARGRHRGRGAGQVGGQGVKLPQLVRAEGVVAPGQQVPCDRVHGVQAARARHKGEGEGIAAELLLHQGLWLPPRAVFVVRVLLHVQRPANRNVRSGRLLARPPSAAGMLG